jgi:hypothetical protein
MDFDFSPFIHHHWHGDKDPTVCHNYEKKGGKDAGRGRMIFNLSTINAGF